MTKCLLMICSLLATISSVLATNPSVGVGVETIHAPLQSNARVSFFQVTLDKPNWFEVVEGTGSSITAAAKNGVEPYWYEWEGATAELNAIGSTLFIPSTLALGDYVVTVRVTDSAAIENMAEASIGFSVIAPAPQYTIVIEENIPNGSISADKSKAVEGEMVTLHALPCEGYTLSHFLIDDITIQGAYFPMPPTDVLVSAVFVKAEVPILYVERADPAAGSLTLAWEDKGGGEGVTYSVWRGAKEDRASALCMTNGLLINTWKDTNYWAAEPVLEPMNYWVVADDGGESERASAPMETRRRFGVFVGLNEEQGFAADARLCQTLALGKGGFGQCKSFTGASVNSGAIRGKIAEFADMAQSGDLFMLFISTHGGEGVLSMAGNQDIYNVAELQTDVRKFNPGVAVIGVVMACHSGSMLGNGIGSEKIISWLLDAGAADCRPNIAWVTSCGYGQYSLLQYGGGGVSPTPFGKAFLQNGWHAGYADGRLYGTGWNGGNGDGMVTFYELARYAAEFAKGYSDDVAPAGVRVENAELLKRLIAGTAGAVGSGQRPDAPASCNASQGNCDASIQVSWDLSHDAAVQSYWLFRKETGEATAKCVSRFAGNGEFSDPGSIRATGLPAKGLKSPEAFKIYTYYVQAVSPRGVSAPSPETSGFAGTTVLRQWLEGLGFSVAEGMEAAETTLAANGHDSILACYVTGLDPNDPDATFEAELVREGRTWRAKPVGGEMEGRVYWVEGKKEMSDEFWTDVTDIENVEEEGWRFFRMGVELAE